RRRQVYIMTVSLVFVFFLFINNIGIFKQSHEPTVLLKGNEKSQNISLTFNISWGEQKLIDIIDVLKEHDVQATFFVRGEWAERHPDLLKLITDNHHELGMLGYRYKNYVEQNIEDIRRDLHYARDVFKRLGYEDLRLLRTPTGMFNKDVIDLAKNLQYKVRSEERRVGKECRARWSTDHGKKKRE